MDVPAAEAPVLCAEPAPNTLYLRLALSDWFIPAKCAQSIASPGLQRFIRCASLDVVRFSQCMLPLRFKTSIDEATFINYYPGPMPAR